MAQVIFCLAVAINIGIGRFSLSGGAVIVIAARHDVSQSKRRGDFAKVILKIRYRSSRRHHHSGGKSSASRRKVVLGVGGGGIRYKSIELLDW